MKKCLLLCFGLFTFIGIFSNSTVAYADEVNLVLAVFDGKSEEEIAETINVIPEGYDIADLSM